METDAIVGTTTLPTIINGYKDMARGLVSKLPFVKLGAGAKRPVRVLKALTGVLKPVWCAGGGCTSWWWVHVDVDSAMAMHHIPPPHPLTPHPLPL